MVGSRPLFCIIVPLDTVLKICGDVAWPRRRGREVTGSGRAAKVIEARKLTKVYGRGEGRVEALAGVSLDVAYHIESGNEDYPALLRAAAELSGGFDGDERERATHVSKTVIRPLATRGTDTAR